jgi:hypothetical protein
MQDFSVFLQIYHTRLGDGRRGGAPVSRIFFGFSSAEIPENCVERLAKADHLVYNNIIPYFGLFRIGEQRPLCGVPRGRRRLSFVTGRRGFS